MGLFKKKIVKKTYDREHMKPVIRASICTGEEVAGFKDIRTGKIEEIMLIRSPEDLEKFKEIYEIIVDRNLLIRRINITANRLVDESSVKKEEVYEQLDLFADYEAQRKKQEEEEAVLDREKRMQEAMLSIKKKFGKSAVLKGMNLQEGATARDRNEQIGGHKA